MKLFSQSAQKLAEVLQHYACMRLRFRSGVLKDTVGDLLATCPMIEPKTAISPTKH